MDREQFDNEYGRLSSPARLRAKYLRRFAAAASQRALRAPLAVRIGAAGCAVGCAVLCGVLLAGCATAPGRSIVIKLPESVWSRPPTIGPRRSVSPEQPGAGAAFDTQLLAYLGSAARPGDQPPGCLPGWVSVDYGPRFDALGCDTFMIADDMPGSEGAVRAELALESGRVIGIVVSTFADSMDAAQELSDRFAGYYGGHCGCSTFSEHCSDCDCGGYMVRVMGVREGATQHPMVSLFYYSDGEAFTEYWRAALAWAKGPPQAPPAGVR